MQRDRMSAIFIDYLFLDVAKGWWIKTPAQGKGNVCTAQLIICFLLFQENLYVID